MITVVTFTGMEGMRLCRYNPRIQTLLCEYDPERVDEDALIERMGAVYAGAAGAALLHVRRLEESGFLMSPTGILSLTLIFPTSSRGYRSRRCSRGYARCCDVLLMPARSRGSARAPAPTRCRGAAGPAARRASSLPSAR